MKHDIQLSLTLYSLSWEFCTGKLSLEDCLRKAKEMGYTGIEMVAAQTVPGYPYPSDEWVDEFNRLMKKYDLTPECYSAYIDMGTRFGEDLTDDEIREITLSDMVLAKRMGFKICRTQHAIGPKMFEAMIPYAKKLGVILAIELHAPHTPEVPVWKELLDVMSRGDGWLGVVPDFSIFAETPHKLHKIQAVEEFGCRPEIVEEIISLHKAGVSQEELLAKPYNDGEKRFVHDMFHDYGDGKAHLEWLDLLLPYTVYCHGKFWYIEEDEKDTTTPCDKILPIIRDYGFKGFIASEYEGHHFDETIDTCEQLSRWVRMANRALGYID